MDYELVNQTEPYMARFAVNQRTYVHTGSKRNSLSLRMGLLQAPKKHQCSCDYSVITLSATNHLTEVKIQNLNNSSHSRRRERPYALFANAIGPFLLSQITRDGFL